MFAVSFLLRLQSALLYINRTDGRNSKAACGFPKLL